MLVASKIQHMIAVYEEYMIAARFGLTQHVTLQVVTQDVTIEVVTQHVATIHDCCITAS